MVTGQRQRLGQQRFVARRVGLRSRRGLLEPRDRGFGLLSGEQGLPEIAADVRLDIQAAE